MRFLCHRKNDSLYVKVHGPIYSHHVAELRKQLQVLAQTEVARFVFDFSGVPFFSSAAPGTFWLFYQDSLRKGKRISIEKTSDYVYDFFRLSQLNQMFSVHH